MPISAATASASAPAIWAGTHAWRSSSWTHAERARLKLLGRARIIDAGAAPDLVGALDVSGYRARVERAVLITVDAFDWSCSQHITPRYTEAQIEERELGLRLRIAELEAGERRD